jgi:hypothetical protein
MALLAEASSIWSGGGGKAVAALGILRAPDRIGWFCHRFACRSIGVNWRLARVNGKSPGLRCEISRSLNAETVTDTFAGSSCREDRASVSRHSNQENLQMFESKWRATPYRPSTIGAAENVLSSSLAALAIRTSGKGTRT